MRRKQIFTICAILAISTAVSAPAKAQAPPATAPAVPGLTLASPAFEDGSIIPGKYTQAVTDFVSPQLQWTNVPPNTVSFVLIAHDPDVALDKKVGDVLHWMAFNIPATATGLPEGVPATATLPDGTVQAKNRRGAIGFLGPGAPAVGPYHHYTFELFALDTKLSLGPDATRAEVLAAIDGHILGKGVLVGRFHK
ncbi:MAG TPA: YbhB/YbcL family Raf kinase inhibitor-like protein [Candidatus Acidoferrales bacterium]|jgi:Raf kinase inhibitor-like YbhB/YbcL family protein|nr:YbhB/YbcL family Raf kinase inhibitor-like protein [Candidatus Acidoferrales bacterium]